jgi:hypothetical protein
MEDAKLPILDHAKREDAHAGQVWCRQAVGTFLRRFGCVVLSSGVTGRPTDNSRLRLCPNYVASAYSRIVYAEHHFAVDDFPRDGEINAADLSSSQRSFVANVHKNLRRAKWVRSRCSSVVMSGATRLNQNE